MKKLILSTAAAVALVPAFAAAPAQASCTQIEGVDRCLESVPCFAYGTAGSLAPEKVRAILPPMYCVL